MKPTTVVILPQDKDWKIPCPTDMDPSICGCWKTTIGDSQEQGWKIDQDLSPTGKTAYGFEMTVILCVILSCIEAQGHVQPLEKGDNSKTTCSNFPLDPVIFNRSSLLVVSMFACAGCLIALFLGWLYPIQLIAAYAGYNHPGVDKIIPKNNHAHVCTCHIQNNFKT